MTPVTDSKLSFLVIEKNTLHASKIELYFAKHGYTVYSTDNGWDALALFLQHKPETIILQAQINKLSSIHFLKYLHRYKQKMNVYLVGSKSSVESEHFLPFDFLRQIFIQPLTNDALEIIRKESEEENRLQPLECSLDSNKKVHLGTIYSTKNEFIEALQAETRRSIRYKFPLNTISIKSKFKYTKEVMLDFFIQQIREFDSMWYDEGKSISFLLPHTGADGGKLLAKRIASALEDKFQSDLHTMYAVTTPLIPNESVAHFLERFEEGLTLSVHSPQEDIAQEGWRLDLYEEIQQTLRIRLYNHYKGMVVTYEADFLSFKERAVLLSAKPIQLASIELEKATYFYSKRLDCTVRASIQSLNYETNSLWLTDFERAQTMIETKKNLRLELNEPIRVTLFDEENHFKADLKELSINDIILETVVTPPFLLESFMQVSFSLDGTKTVTLQAEMISMQTVNQRTLSHLKIFPDIKTEEMISDHLSSLQLLYINELQK